MSAEERTDPEEKMGLARAFAVHKSPYFAKAIHGFVFRAIPGLPTMLVTPGMVLGYGREWAEEASVSMLAADIVHECHHFVRLHFLRAGLVKYPDLWNLAGDCAINPGLVAEGWDLASNAVFPKQFGLPDNLTTEEYYEIFSKAREKEEEKKKKEEKDGKPEKPGDQKEDKTGANKPDTQQGQTKGDKEKKAAEGGQKPGQGKGQKEGDKGGSKPQPGEGGISAGKCGGLGGHSDYKDLEASLDAEAARTDVEKENIATNVAADVRDYVESGRGDVPADLVTWAKQEQKELPKVNWRTELSEYLRNCTGVVQSGGDDYSMARPSRRSYVQGILRPGLVEYQPVVAFVLDTSASMQSPQLKESIDQAVSVIEQLGIDEVWFAEADAAVSMEFRTVNISFFQNIKLKGGGGTDFRPALKAAQQLNPVPDILLYYTDGDGHAPSTPPFGIQVIWVVVPGHWNKPPAKWGHTVLVPLEAKP